MSDDVVAELDRWLAVWGSHFGGTQSVDMEVVQRARDEIEALRGYLAECERQFQAKVAEIGTLLDRVHQARGAALEEAARVCDQKPGGAAEACAIGIRALKGPAHD